MHMAIWNLWRANTRKRSFLNSKYHWTCSEFDMFLCPSGILWPKLNPEWNPKMHSIGVNRSRRNYIVLAQRVENGTPKAQKEWKLLGLCPLLFLHFHSLCLRQFHNGTKNSWQQKNSRDKILMKRNLPLHLVVGSNPISFSLFFSPQLQYNFSNWFLAGRLKRWDPGNQNVSERY